MGNMCKQEGYDLMGPVQTNELIFKETGMKAIRSLTALLQCLSARLVKISG